MRYPTEIQHLLKFFSKFPGVGPKTAERFVFWLLRQPTDFVNEFASVISASNTANKVCGICFNISSQTPCVICRDNKRDASTICVVEDVSDLFAIEASGEYHGLYHVLGGLIKPLDGITPEKLNITPLLARLVSTQVKEVVLGLNPTLEGETTLLYLVRILKEAGVPRLTTLGRGLPYGADLEYADTLTLTQALQSRKVLN